MGKFYVTTSIAYVNGAPHIGFALEVIQADCLARYHRLKGDDTYYLTGTDEHGVKIYETAKEEGMETQAFVDKNAEKFMGLKSSLNLTNDDFIRTTYDFHKKGAQKLWEILMEKGDIYKGSYKGNYCSGCEAFILDKDLDEEGNCAIHKRKPKEIEEENYFFKLSKYSDQIKAAIESGELKVIPESRKNEMLNIIGDGLTDVSFSRNRAVLPWGVEVPGDSEQVMYVWCDALSNYITAIGFENDSEKFEKYWPCDVHLIGKDILRFHAGIWIGMLLSAEIPLPKAIYVHGFITSEGHKMSKSLGNVVDPFEYTEKYGVDAVRFYLLREIPTTDDGDFSRDRFEQIYNSELANGIGNLVNRVTMMTERYAEGKVPAFPGDFNLYPVLNDYVENYQKAFDDFDLKRACEIVIQTVDLANKYIDDMKPWVLAKEGKDTEVAAILYNLLESLRFISCMLYPLIPETAEKIAAQLGLSRDSFDLDLKWGALKEGSEIKKGDVLFPKLED
ncbi:methionine--tRNA ligase [Candidatus Peregrinibacteria bacterium]|nr:methionine--tRNA ligase [Candidatus Peregrinibacteria bacterium]